MKFTSRKTTLCLIVLLLFVIVFIYPFVMFVFDIIDGRGSYIECLDGVSKTRSKYIPKLIHQMFFNISNEKIPDHLVDAQLSWTKVNPDFQYILWNASMVEELMKQKYPSYLEVYRSYTHWVQRADFARYFVLHQHGGIYADIDIECVRNMSTLNRTLPTNAEFVMYWTTPYGVSNDFLISRPGDPFITTVINGLARANRWYVLPYLTVFFSTGPAYLYARYLSYVDKQNIHILSNEEMLDYLFHEPGASWHEVDGKILWWIYEHIQLITVLLSILLSASVFMVLVWRVKSSKMSSVHAYWKAA